MIRVTINLLIVDLYAFVPFLKDLVFFCLFICFFVITNVIRDFDMLRSLDYTMVFSYLTLKWRLSINKKINTILNLHMCINIDNFFYCLNNVNFFSLKFRPLHILLVVWVFPHLTARWQHQVKNHQIGDCLPARLIICTWWGCTSWGKQMQVPA